MDAEVLICGYSYHDRPFAQSYRHGLTSYLLRLQTEGSCEILLDGVMKPVTQGDLLLFAKGEPYDLRMAERDGAKISSGDYYVFCRGAWVEEWWKRSARANCRSIQMDEGILSLWRQITLEKRRLEEEDRELSGCLLKALCLSLDRAASITADLPKSAFVAARMKRFIEEHATQTFRVEDVARHVGYSTSRAVHLFKEACAMTMMQYALEIRLSIAAERMRYSAYTLEQIAEGCGFGSYPFFHRAFRAKYGMSPRAFRSSLVER